MASATVVEGEKVFSITRAGADYLELNRDIVGRLEAGMEYAGVVGEFSFMGNLREIREMLMDNGEYLDEAKMRNIDEILAETRKKIASVVFG